eukprot:1775355-Rhodomonas_salina.1
MLLRKRYAQSGTEIGHVPCPAATRRFRCRWRDFRGAPKSFTPPWSNAAGATRCGTQRLAPKRS